MTGWAHPGAKGTGVVVARRDPAVKANVQSAEKANLAPHMADRDRILANLAHRLAQTQALDLRPAVICIAIDKMRPVNETKGYLHGDHLLDVLHERLCTAVAGIAGIAEIGRISGDEFVVLPLRNLGSVEQSTDGAMRLARMLLEIVQQPLHFGVHVDWMTASLGVSTATASSTAERLLQEADMALAKAKADGGNQITIFAPGMRARLRNRTQLETDLRAAIRNGEFLLYAQPQVVVRDEIATITGHEILVRWNHPRLGLLAPSHFICQAEKTGMIRDIDLWMVEQGCQLLARWAKDPMRRHLRVSANVSTLHFRDPTFADRIAAIIAKAGAPMQRLTLEVTETRDLEDVVLAEETMQRLRQMGLSLSLDDFGTGFSSMSLLRRLPFSEIKIDRSFVAGLPGDLRASEIVAHMIRLSRGLGLDIIAEGVETPAQMQWLLHNDCCSVQGFLFGRPERVNHVPDGAG